mgnify:CR=1 FL=1
MAFGQRQGEGEARAAGGDVLGGELPAVGLHQRAGDGQPQPRRAVLHAGLVAAIEALDDVGQVGDAADLGGGADRVEVGEAPSV